MKTRVRTALHPRRLVARERPPTDAAAGRAGGVEILAAIVVRLERAGEQVGEVAARELGAYFGARRRFLERVVRVARHAGAGIAEDAADLDDVEADVDDQVGWRRSGGGRGSAGAAHLVRGRCRARVGT
jgi:hypothetical protein